jgi:hypothetical protein
MDIEHTPQELFLLQVVTSQVEAHRRTERTSARKKLIIRFGFDDQFHLAHAIMMPHSGMLNRPSLHLIAEVPRRPARVEITIGIDLGDVWSHYCTLNEKGEVVDRGRFRTSPKGVEKCH